MRIGIMSFAHHHAKAYIRNLSTIPDVELKITNPNEEGIGEILIKGPNVMKGYYKREEETLRVLKDGWFNSGDLGYIDEDGYLYITGRKKEIIVLSSGKNIYPEEVESHYAKSPFIKESCVLGIGEREEESLAAVIVPNLEYCRKVGEINLYGKIKWELENLSEKLPSYKRIKGFIVAKEDLPRTRLGKIKRFEVKDRYLDELKGRSEKEAKGEIPSTEEDLMILSSEIARKIIEVLNKEAKIERRIYLSDHLELDLGIDSLGRVELLVALEGLFKIDIPDDAMAKVFTVKEFILGMEKLILSEKFRESASSQVKTQGFILLWNKILNRRPAENIVKKLDLSPRWFAMVFTSSIYEILYIVFRIIWRLRIFGTKNIPQKGAFLLCANHTSYLDAFIIAASIPRRLRKDLFFIGYRAFFEFFVIKNIIKLIKVIPVDPATHLVETMEACSYVLRNGKAVCIFPEGERTIDGEVKNFKKGIGILAKELGVPLVPVYISGSYESWPRTKPLPRPHPIKITFGRPFDFEELKKEGLRLGAKDDYEAVALGIREEVIKLKGKQ